MELPCVYTDEGCVTTRTTPPTTGAPATSGATLGAGSTTSTARDPQLNYNADNYYQATTAYENLVGQALPKGSAHTVKLDGQNQVTFSYTNYNGSRFTFTVQSDGSYSNQTMCGPSDSTCTAKSNSGTIPIQAAHVLFASAGATGITLNPGEQAALAQFQGALVTARSNDQATASYLGGCI